MKIMKRQQRSQSIPIFMSFMFSMVNHGKELLGNPWLD